MPRPLILIISLLFFFIGSEAQLVVRDLRCMDKVNPSGIGESRPLFSWRLAGGGQGILQTAYRVVVETEVKGDTVWDSGRVADRASIHIVYGGLSLRPAEQYRWRVRVWDNKGRESDWSAVATVGLGLLSAGDWTAKWISEDRRDQDDVDRIPPVFSRAFNIGKRIHRAYLYITAHGLYEGQLNGKRIGTALLTPGWTSYDRRLQYQAYDVTALLSSGKNRVQVTVGDGWWRGVFGGDMRSDHYGNDASLLFQLDLIYSDGSRERILSDSSWQVGYGPIRYADLYNGEVYDARVGVREGRRVKVMDYTMDNLAATESEPVRQQQRLKAVKVFTDPMGETLIDFGQNISGWVQCRLAGRGGDSVSISHAEALDRDGNFYTGNLREARARDVYIMTGGAPRMFEPHFTYHGFRYIRIKGLRKMPKAEDFTAVAISSDCAITGTFECSDSRINQLQRNIGWSQQDNFLHIPTDCPQRSERYGWTGDAQIFARTASYNRDVSGFFSGWLKDLAADQDDWGAVPVIIPDLNGHRSRSPKRGIAGWGDAATIVPWTMFRAYGDTNLLRRQYPSMKAWVDYITHSSVDNCWNANGYGDWLAPDTITPTPVPYISQCYYGLSAKLLIATASVLGQKEDSIYYSVLLDKIETALLRRYMPLPATETGYLLPLAFGLLPDSLKGGVVERLVKCVHEHGDMLSTGFLGTPCLLPVLTRYGQTDLAYKILLQEAPPSWLYPVKMGATTIWEKWDAISPDGKVGEKSLNHYAYGAVGDWLYRDVAGIMEEEAGYRRIRIAPHPGGGLSWVNAGYDCLYGRIVSNWKTEAGRFRLHVEIPENTSAEVYLPGGTAPVTVGSGRYDWDVAL